MMRKFVSGLLVLGVAGGAAALSALATPGPAPTVPAPTYGASGVPVSIACGAGFSNLFKGGINASDVDVLENSSAAFIASGTDTVTGPNGKLEGRGGVVWQDDLAAGTYSAPAGEVTLAGGNVFVGKNGDARGVAASPCLSPSRSVWLIGSASGAGFANALYVGNPGQRPITVRIEAFGSSELNLGSAGQFSVDPGAVTRYSLDGVVPRDPRISLRLSSDSGAFGSGAFGAMMQVAQLDGATPAGVDVIQPSAQGRVVTIPGLSVGDDDAPILRVANPGDATNFSVTLIGKDGPVAVPGAADVPLSAKTSLDLTLGGVEPGTYTVVVTAKDEVSASARESAGRGPRDFAWIPAASASTDSSAAWGEGTSARIVLSYLDEQGAAAGTTNASLTSYGADGKILEDTTVLVRGLVDHELPEGTRAVTLHSDQPVVGTVRLEAPVDGGKGIAALGLTTPANATRRSGVVVAN